MTDPLPETRERLLDAAWGCVASDGLSSATSRSITQRAEANLGSITYYFGSKDALVAEALVRAIRRLVEPAIEALADETLDPAARFLAAIAALQEALDAQRALAPAYLEALLHSQRSPEVAAATREVFGELRGLLSTVTATQRDDGFLPPWVDADAMAALLLAVAQGVVLQAVIDPAGPAAPAMAAQFAQVLLAARGVTDSGT